MFILEIANGYPFDTNPLLGLFELEQAKSLSGLGHKVVFVGVDLRSLRRKRKLGYSHFFDDKIEVYNYAFPLGRIPVKFLAFFEFFFMKKLYNRIEKEHGKPDILHAHFCFLQGYIAAKLKAKYRIPLAITEHSSELINGISRFRKKYFSYGYNAADIIISVSSAVKDRILYYFNKDSCVIPNIANLVFFKDLDENTFLLNRTHFLFISAGGLIKRKGMDALIKAFANVKADNVQLMIIGEGEERKNLENIILRYSLNDRVKLLGYRTPAQMADILATADCFVLASRAETFGIVYIEALAMGLPIIATDCGGPTDIIKDNNGYMVEVDDISGLTIAMQKILTNYSKFTKKEIAEAARKKYAPASIAKELENEMYKVLANPERN